MNLPDQKLFVESIHDLPKAKDYTGIYLGSEVCATKLTNEEQYPAIFEEAVRTGLSIHFVTPPTTQSNLECVLTRIDQFATIAPGHELIVNDFGLLEYSRRHFGDLILVAGRILTLTFGDSTGEQTFQSIEKKYRSDPDFSSFIDEFSIRRFELQASDEKSMEKNESPLKYTMHVPYAYLASSPFCIPTEKYFHDGRLLGKNFCAWHCENN